MAIFYSASSANLLSPGQPPPAHRNHHSSPLLMSPSQSGWSSSRRRLKPSKLTSTSTPTSTATSSLASWQSSSSSRSRFVPYLVLAPCILAILVWISIVLDGANPLIWVIDELCNGRSPLALCGYWMMILAFGLPAISPISQYFQLKRTSTRKLFHAMATVMFVPAALINEEFLCLAMAVGLAVLMLMELLRLTRCPPFGEVIHLFCTDFLDRQQDRGAVFMTQMYLLLGCAVPVWLCRGAHSASLLKFSGIIALGVGDSMGAMVGSRFGRWKWVGSRRTMEGSLAVFFSTFFTLFLLQQHLNDKNGLGGLREVGGDAHDYFYHHEEAGTNGVSGGEIGQSMSWSTATDDGSTGSGLVGDWLHLGIPVLLVTLMEAFTSQVDNLVLPCYAFSALTLLA